jgi:hypothetical protein
MTGMILQDSRTSKQTKKLCEFCTREMLEGVVTLIQFVVANCLLLINKCGATTLMVLVTQPVIITWNLSHNLMK